MQSKIKISGEELKALRNYKGLSQEETASMLDIDRGTLSKIEKSNLVSADILDKFLEVTNIYENEIQEILLKIRQNQNNFSNIKGVKNMEDRVSNLVFDSFSQNLKGKDAEVESLKRANAELQKQLDSSNLRFFDAQRQIDAIKYQIELENLKLDNKLKEQKTYMEAYVEKSLDEFSQELQKQIQELIQNEIGSKNKLGDKVIESIPYLSPVFEGLGKILQSFSQKINQFEPIQDNFEPRNEKLDALFEELK